MGGNQPVVAVEEPRRKRTLTEGLKLTLPALRRNRYLEVAIVLAVCGFLFFYGLGSFGLVGADEPRYAQIGAEMLARHDWIVPTLNGSPWLEKPALLYWSEMASYVIFGVHDWAARIPVAFMSTAMVLALYFFVRRRSAEWALDAALIMAASVGAIGFGRAASTDMPLTACLTIALLAWLEWFRSRVPDDERLGKGGNHWLIVFYVFCALGMLAKGPVAPFLAGLFILVFAAILRRGKIISGTLWWPGSLVFLVIALPWYVAVQIKTGDFFQVFILQHNLERFGTNLYQHEQPFWYYVPVLLALVMPWTALLLAECVRLVRLGWRELVKNEEKLFVILWFLVPVIFFSLSHSKLPGYVLPSVPAAVLMIVYYLQEREDARLPILVTLAHGVLCGALFAGVLLSPHFLLRVHPTAAAIATATIAGAMVFILVVFVLGRRGVHFAHVVTLLPVVVGIGFVIKIASPDIDATQSARPLAHAIDRAMQRTKTGTVALYDLPRPEDYGVHYYVRQAVTVEDPATVTGRHLLVAPRKSPLPNIPHAMLEQVPPRGINIYFVPSRVPRRAPPY